MKKSPNGIASESGARSLLQTNHGAVFQGTGCGHGHATDDEELSPAAERAISHLLVSCEHETVSTFEPRGSGVSLQRRNSMNSARDRLSATAADLDAALDLQYRPPSR